MRFIYNLILHIVQFLLPIVALFNKKMRLFVGGRKNVISSLSQKIQPNDTVVWFHVSSLGEYEQGLPVMEAFKKEYPFYKIVLSFFSPSGYEIRKNNTIADVTVYLPLDTRKNAQQFLNAVHPSKIFFIKYEFWPNYLIEIRKRHIPTFLVSGIVRENQLFFKKYGGFYRNLLHTFTHFFVQNTVSEKLLNSIGFYNVTVNGDTRFDRVSQILEKDNTIEIISQFKNGKKTIVVGSSWPQDEALLVPYINQSEHIKFIIAPHNIKPEAILNLKNQILKKTLLYSESDGADTGDFDVLIVDCIGILTKIYSYADIAYVGGGFGNGIHNILEPATFGIPVVIGPNFKKFQEAKDLVALGGCMVITDQKSLQQTFTSLLSDDDILKEKGMISKSFVLKNKNATQAIMDYLH